MVATPTAADDHASLLLARLVSVRTLFQVSLRTLFVVLNTVSRRGMPVIVSGILRTRDGSRWHVAKRR